VTGQRIAAAGAPGPGGQGHRVIFIDFARAMAVVLMIIGHSVSALLHPDYNSGPWYDAWQFQRGLTSSLFLLLSGFAFSVATTRHWTLHTHPSRAVFRRLRRFSFFIMLGYTLHVPVLPITRLLTVDAAGWRTFFQVDVLQLIGITFVGVQALVMICRTRALFMAVSFLLAVALVALTPPVWNVDWTATLPVSVAAYLSPGTGSIFPLFPFAASVLIGAGAGQIYARWPAGRLAVFESQVLLGAGGLMALAALMPRLAGVSLYGPGPGAFIPVEFVLRTGVSLVILGVIAHLSRRITHLPRVFGAAAQESLLVYYAHLCVVYGSIWGPGLVQALGVTLRPIQTLPVALVLVVAMLGLAWQWNWCKHAKPAIAWWIRAAVAAIVLYRLL
jgi:hypothetical protein